MRPLIVGYAVGGAAHELSEHQSHWRAWRDVFSTFARVEGYALDEAFVDTTDRSEAFYALLEHICARNVHTIVVPGLYHLQHISSCKGLGVKEVSLALHARVLTLPSILPVVGPARRVVRPSTHRSRTEGGYAAARVPQHSAAPHR